MRYNAVITLTVELCGDYESKEEAKQEIEFSDLLNQHPVGMVLIESDFELIEREDDD